jgi:hypothetical protein
VWRLPLPSGLFYKENHMKAEDDRRTPDGLEITNRRTHSVLYEAMDIVASGMMYHSGVVTLTKVKMDHAQLLPEEIQKYLGLIQGDSSEIFAYTERGISSRSL